MDKHRYVSDFINKHSDLISADNGSMLDFLNNPDKLCPSISPSSKGAYAGSERFDAMMPDFINDLPEEEALKIFRAKFITDLARRNILYSFLKDICSDPIHSASDIDIIRVKDLSTGRARFPGHVVYRIDLMLQGHRPRTIFLKGFGRNEYKTLRSSFSGWDNRPQMHLYEEFAQNAANIAGVSRIRSKFYKDPHDDDFQGFTLAEAIPGIHSNQLFDLNEKAEIKPVYTEKTTELIDSVAAWHAFADIVGKADRRFLQLTPKYSRPTNYLIEPGTMSVEGVDHEYLFLPQSLVTFELKNRFSEMSMLAALPANALPGHLIRYTNSYISHWNRIMQDGSYSSIRALAAQTFGEGSVEVNFCSKILLLDPDFC